MVFETDLQELVLVGGVEDYGIFKATAHQIRTATVESLVGGGHFVVHSTSVASGKVVETDQQGFCDGPTHPCILRVDGNEDSGLEVCDFTNLPYDACTGDVFGGCYGDLSIIPETDPPCQVAPQCTGSELLSPGTFLRTEIWNGRADAAVVYEPGLGIWSYGGTYACYDECPTPHPVVDLDHAGRLDSTAAINTAQRLHMYKSASGAYWNVASSGEPTNRDAFIPVGWPSEATVGLRGAVGVVTGFDWDPQARRWVDDLHDNDAPRHLLIGGTSHQEVSPEATFQVETRYSDPQCTEVEIPDLPIWIPTPVETLLGPAGFNPDAPVLQVDPTSMEPTYAAVPSVLPQRACSGATAFDTKGVLVFGGDVQLAPPQLAPTPEVKLYNPVSGTVIDVGSVQWPVSGAVVVTDPWTRKAWAVGGTLDAAAAWSIHYVPTLVNPASSSTFEILGLEQEMIQVDGSDLRDATWRLRYGYALEHHCGSPTNPGPSWASPDLSDRCFADEIKLTFLDQSPATTPDGAERAEATVRVRFGEDTPWYPATPIGTPKADADGDGIPDDGYEPNGAVEGSYLHQFSRSYRLPRTLADGEQLDVEVTFNTPTTESAVSTADLRINRAAVHYAELGDAATQMVYLRNALVRPDGAETSVLWRSHIEAESPYSGAAPGLAAPCETTSFSVLDIEPTSQSRCFITGDGGAVPYLETRLDDLLVLVTADLAPVGSTINGRLSTLAEGGLSEDVQSSILVNTTVQGPEDLAWLESLLGPLPGGYWSVVLTRPPSTLYSTDVNGWNMGGIIWMTDFQPDGTNAEGYGNTATSGAQPWSTSSLTPGSATRWSRTRIARAVRQVG